MTIHDGRVFSAWAKDVLEDGGLTVGYALAPASVPTGAGYVVVWPIAGGITEGTLDDPNHDATPNLQFSCSSLDPAQSEWLAAKVRTLLEAAVPAELADGRTVMFVEFPFGGETLLRDDDSQPPRYTVPARAQFRTG